MTSSTKLAVLGLGTMGGAMARSALRAGIATVVWNRQTGAARPFEELGAEIAKSAADAAGNADVVITMVTDAAAVTSIALDQGMLEALASGSVWAQMSTIGVEETEAIWAIVQERRDDVLFLDAPVSGSKVPAEEGRLTIFASGPDAARPKAEPVFEAIGQRTAWVGPVGSGSRVKLVNNTLLAFTNEGVASSLALAHRLGLDTRCVIEAFEGSPLVSSWTDAKFRRIEREDYSAEFPLRLALKDVNLALDQVDPERFMAFSSLAREWERIVERGSGDEDLTIVTRSLESEE